MDAVMSRASCTQTTAKLRTAKSCGPGAATVASIHAGLCWQGNGDKKRRSPGRARISRQTSRGEGRRSRLHLWCFARVLRHAGCPRASARGICGCIRRPAFPAPSPWRGTMNSQELGQIVSREQFGCRRPACRLRQGFGDRENVGPRSGGAGPGDPVVQRRLCLNRQAAAYWITRFSLARRQLRRVAGDTSLP